ncbi:MAG: RNA polymerase sigma factor [Gemmatimonadota bacterium]
MGDPEAMTSRELEGWLERLHEESFGWALSCCCGERAGAEDVLQSTYLRVIAGEAVFGGRSAFRTWLFGVIRRVAWEHNRRARTERTRTLRLDHPDARDARMVADNRAAPDNVDSSRTLQAGLARLPARQREVLHLVFYQDMSIAEAADVMEISVGSARTHYERGKARLKALLADSMHERPSSGS